MTAVVEMASALHLRLDDTGRVSEPETVSRKDVRTAVGAFGEMRGPVNDLYDELKRCKERLGRLAGKRIGEQNTKASLIEPVIGALGWELLDPDEVHREFRRRPSDNPVDYALLHLRDTRLFIEAKGLGENFDDPKWASQMISYAATAGVSWVVLTDGREWRI